MTMNGITKMLTIRSQIIKIGAFPSSTQWTLCLTKLWLYLQSTFLPRSRWIPHTGLQLGLLADLKHYRVGHLYTLGNVGDLSIFLLKEEKQSDLLHFSCNVDLIQVNPFLLCCLKLPFQCSKIDNSSISLLEYPSILFLDL